MNAHGTEPGTTSSDPVQHGLLSGGGATTTAAAPVKLTATSASMSGATVTVDLEFSTAMKKGAGFIYITDGAVQTVIDRVTGLPGIRIVGATETRKIPVADAVVSGNHVLVSAAGLGAGQYSVFMDEGVLTSSSLRSFAGLTKPGAAALTVTDPGPAVLSMVLGDSVVAADAPVQLTITFSEPVDVLPGSALTAQNASVDGFVKVGDGTVWTAWISTSGLAASVGNQVTLDLSQVRDAKGNAGAGTAQSLAYVIDDGQAPTATIELSDAELVWGETGTIVVRFSEPVPSLSLDAFSAPYAKLSDLASADGGKTWTLKITPAGAGLDFDDLQVGLDMSKVIDTAGHSGSGITLSPAYGVDTRDTLDTIGPELVSVSFDGSVLDASHDLVATIVFSEAVQEDGLYGAIRADHAILSDLASSDGGKTWTVKLSLADAGQEPVIGEFGVSLYHVLDLAGNNGPETLDKLPSYAVNTLSAFMEISDYEGIDPDDGLLTDDWGRSFDGVFLGDFSDPQDGFLLTVDGEAIDNGEIGFHVLDGVLYWQYNGEESWTAGTHTVVATARQTNGSEASITRTVEVDGSHPTIVATASAGGTDPFDIGEDLVIRFSEAVYFPYSNPKIWVSAQVNGVTSSSQIAILPSYLSSDRTTLSIPASAHHLPSGASVTLSLSSMEDLAGNALSDNSFSFATVGAVVDNAAPVALEAWLEGYSVGPKKSGDTVAFTIGFDEAVSLFGTGPRYVNMNNGGKAYYHAASADFKELEFRYTVDAGDGNIDALGIADLGSLVGQLKDAHDNVLSDAHVDFGPLILSGYGSIEIDVLAPARLDTPTLALASDTGSAGDYQTSDDTPTLKGGNAEPGARILIELDGAGVDAWIEADDAGDWDWTPDAALAPGVHTLVVRQSDAAGNLSAPRSLSLTIESLAAVTPLDAPRLAAGSDTGVADSDGVTQDATPTYSGSGAQAGSTIKLFAGSDEVGSATVGSDGGWSITASALAEGSHAIVAREYVNGVQTNASAAASLVVDRTAPRVSEASVDNFGRSYSLSFDEAIVFAAGGNIGMWQGAVEQKGFTAGGGGWDQPSADTVTFDMGGLNGLFQMQLSAGALRDLAGNVAIIGSADLEFTLAPTA
ncbi:hypothetical protein B0920_14510 [Massilia sp. KIM]|uniref:Ig-like domain-containing protein n=1 Tax=Massilia sp. KIM TaxID=1955422 RepID=UPI00098FC910|nr:Ig-like domain-containing protein [Massilia sp. KIM]OON64486.1 hypothetical protein B0920_14510 [Massilia sp. KIM]